MATTQKAQATKKATPTSKTPPSTLNKVSTGKAAAPQTTEKKSPNAAFMKPLTPSTHLAAVIGKTALPRTEVTKNIWKYIKKHKLQDSSNKRMINADDKLKVIFGKDQVSMFEMTKLLSAHLK